MSALAHAGRWELVGHILSEMIVMKVVPTAVSYTIIIDSCKGNHDWLRTLSTLSSMRETTLEISIITYGAALGTLANAHQWAISICELAELPRRGLQANSIIFNDATSCTEFGLAWSTSAALLSALTNGGLRCDVTICSGIQRQCTRDEEWRCALGAIAEMKERGMGATAANQHAAMTSPVTESWSRGLALLKTMGDTGLQRTCVTVGAFAGALDSENGWHLALAVAYDGEAGGLEMSVIAHNEVIAALGDTGEWRRAIHMLMDMQGGSITPSLVSWNAALDVCAKSGEWQVAAALLAAMLEWSFRPSLTSFNSVLTACDRAGQWRRALAFLAELDLHRLEADKITCSALLSACARCEQSDAGQSILSEMAAAQMERGVISFNAALAACQREGAWTVALDLSSELRAQAVVPDTITCNTVISACDKSARWQEALFVYDSASADGPKPDVISCKAIISACTRCGEKDVAREMFEQMLTMCRSQPASSIAWSLAKLGIDDPDLLDPLVASICEEVSQGALGCREVAVLAWSCGTLGIQDRSVFQGLGKKGRQFLRKFTLHDLLLFSWGLAAADALERELFADLEGELVARLRAVSGRAALGDFGALDWGTFLDNVRGMLWSFHFAGVLSSELLHSARAALLQVAEWKHKDGSRSEKAVVPELLAYTVQPSFSSGTDNYPRVELDLADRMVIFKPPGWEVYDKNPSHEDFQLATFVQAWCSERKRPILRDEAAEEQACGFMHRLDVPSSGLILAAKTYEAYVDMTCQLSSGKVVRDYTVLCHGWMPAALREVRARVSWRGTTATTASSTGKPSITRTKVVSHLVSSASEAFTVVSIRIATGRRHQIRCHTSFIGHATVTDGMYTSLATATSDVEWCTRNFLHRHRLSFLDAAGRPQEVLARLPEDLCESLQCLAAKDTVSQEAFARWRRDNTAPCDWRRQRRLTAQSRRHV
eukprot:TRINITY_DN51119_c0_g2_i1.p1 TRINITY_DN51119_c0_g2~~TRINITY_DN51119_c0_g2_i1.p1  ORF type:complete len:1092 (+),score=161.17 TRINITY_DN51119_c0_g2_i1:435-3278(+)